MHLLNFKIEFLLTNHAPITRLYREGLNTLSFDACVPFPGLEEYKEYSFEFRIFLAWVFWWGGKKGQK
jgi:hypothetical protein